MTKVKVKTLIGSVVTVAFFLTVIVAFLVSVKSLPPVIPVPGSLA